MTLYSPSMIGVTVLLAAVSLAGASLECEIPGNTPEGCVYCYSCAAEEVIVTTTEEVVMEVIDVTGKCQAVIDSWGLTIPADEKLCTALDSIGYDVVKEEKTSVTTSTIVQNPCECEPTPVATDCLASTEDNTLFTLDCPTNKTFPSSITICQWNLPQAEQVYMNLLKQDIEGNPNDEETGCKDKLIIRSEDEDVVTCGTLPSMRPATKIYNSIYSKAPSVFFVLRDEAAEDCCFKILVCLEMSQGMNIMGDATTNQPRMDGRANVTVDLCAPPSGSPFTTCCTCPEIDIKMLCPEGSWNRNPLITRLQTLSTTSRTCDGIGETGFSGLKGCIGAEFLTSGTLPSSFTEEQCETMTLGMTAMEAEVFLSPQGGSLWCGCNAVSSSSSSFCAGDEATRPDAKELVKLEQLIAGEGDVDECASSGNDILQKVATFLRDNDNTIPSLEPCPID